MQEEKILNAIKDEEIIRVRYFGGSYPGAERHLYPISLSNGKLRARCMSSGMTKTFMIEKMEEVIDGVPSVMAVTLPVTPLTFPTLKEFTAHYFDEFIQQGWFVQQNEECLSLHRKRKNGTPLKGADVGICYEATTIDLVFNFNGKNLVEEEILHDRVRPWSVWGKNKTTRSFGDIVKAQRAFLEYAQTLSPSRAGAA